MTLPIYMTPSEHLAEEALETYALGRFATEEETEAIEEHLLHCVYCQTRQQKMDGFVQAMQSATKTVSVAPSKTKPNSYAVIAIAAAAAVIFFIPRGLETPVAVELSAVRNEAKLVAPAGKPLKVKIDLTGLATGVYKWELVSSGLSGAVNPNEPILSIPALAKGQYWVRLRETSTNGLVREFSLAVR